MTFPGLVTINDLKTFVGNHLAPEMQARGFPIPPRSRWNSFRKKIGNNIIQDITLLTRKNSLGQFCIMVSCGVRLTESQKLFAKATGMHGEHRTLGDLLCNIAKDSKCPLQWHFDLTVSPSHLSAEILSWIDIVATPFLNHHNNAAAVELYLREHIQVDKGEIRTSYCQQLAAILATSGRVDEARRILQSELERLKDAPQKYRYSTQDLLEYLNKH